MKTFSEYNKKLNESALDGKSIGHTIFNLRDAGAAIGQGMYEDIGNEVAKLKSPSESDIKRIVDKHIKITEKILRDDIAQAIKKA